MIDAIIGLKGSGKTSQLVDEINEKAARDDTNIVCIEYGRRFDRNIPYHVRLIDITEYPVNNYRELLAFIAGISAKDYDISHIYIDSIYKIAQDDDHDHLSVFFNDLHAFAEQIQADVTITISDEYELLPDNVKEFARKK